MDIRILPALNGDCILISFGEINNRKNILIDGGVGRTYRQCLKKYMKDIRERGEFIDLLIVTHIDEDHIGGICKYFEDIDFDETLIKKMWFNSNRNIKKYFDNDIDTDNDVDLSLNTTTDKSYRQAISLEEQLLKYDFWVKEVIEQSYNDEIGECKIRVLSPNLDGLKALNNKWEVEKNKITDKARKSDYNRSIKVLSSNKDEEDKSIPNKSSIATLIDYKGNNILFLGDSYPSVIIESLNQLGYNEKNKLIAKVVKVSHHGSRKNISKDLLKVIDCSNYIISTNSESYGLPDKECLSKIIENKRGVNLYFNYDYVNKKKIFSKEDISEYTFECNILKSEIACDIDGGIHLWR